MAAACPSIIQIPIKTEKGISQIEETPAIKVGSRDPRGFITRLDVNLDELDANEPLMRKREKITYIEVLQYR